LLAELASTDGSTASTIVRLGAALDRIAAIGAVGATGVDLAGAARHLDAALARVRDMARVIAVGAAAVDLDAGLDAALDAALDAGLDAGLDAALDLTAGRLTAAVVALSDSPSAATLEAVETLIAELGGVTVEMRRLAADSRQGAVSRVPRTRILGLRRLVGALVSSITDKPAAIAEPIRRNVEQLDVAVRELTMVPVSDVVDRFHKMVVDLGSELGKSIDKLEIEGSDICIDEQLSSRVRDVLVHALRNSIDHGIEAPETRRASGKRERAQIAVRCFRDSGEVRFEISDDGRGIDADEIRAKAVERELVSAAEAGAMSDRDALSLLFRPGFSLADQITHISGRGVGMDVIHSTVRELGGGIELDSVVGTGTTLTLRIPDSTTEVKAA
jgi:two-component system chemotaxis sensor kinase CheA